MIPPDTRPPVIDDTGWEVAETAGEGTEVYFNRTATDDRDPNPVVVCDPPSGTWFPLGLNYTTCVATDNAGNSSDPVQIGVLVLPPDTTPPQFYYMPDIVADAKDPNGATVDVYIIATDDRGDPVVTCRRAADNVPIDRIGSALFPVNAKGQDTPSPASPPIPQATKWKSPSPSTSEAQANKPRT